MVINVKKLPNVLLFIFKQDIVLI